jgi:FkbM family methyltransferase
MISVLTLTYKRHHLLEEAIQSFLAQELPPECEMVVINDNPEVDYVYNHPKVRIINHKERFPSIAAKIEWGYKQCKYDYIYRLDDDDLLAPWALKNAKIDIETNPGYDVYRSEGMYFFVNNVYEKESSNINNGNIYTKAYLDRITWPNTSNGEDADITFHKGGKVYHSKLKNTMLYRWGMGTFHISGLGEQSNQVILDHADKVLDNTKGNIELFPKFLNNYYEQITNKKMKVYIQLGANTGNDEFQHMVNQSDEKLNVFLLEPNTDLIPELTSVYSRLSGIHNVTICPFGISLTTGEQELYQYGDIYGNYSLLNRKSHPLKNISTSKKIETKTFEDFCNEYNIQKIECLFIDTEGLDYEILNSIDLDKVDIKTIIIEEWDHEDDDMNNVYKTGPKFLHEVLIPKCKDYYWEEFISGGMNNFKLTKK